MTEEWTSRWHITGKNEVIRQWSHEDGQQAYRRYQTTSRPSLQNLITLDEHIGRFDNLWSRMSIVFVARSTPVHDFHTVFRSLWRSDESAGRYSTRVDKRVENYMIVTCGRRESTRR
ncbi:hypothetical protein ETC03_19275 [Geobacillus sp. MMMUD3]|nr:hypothetical protein [Geobacillus sp. MMMUD3]